MERQRPAQGERASDESRFAHRALRRRIIRTEVTDQRDPVVRVVPPEADSYTTLFFGFNQKVREAFQVAETATQHREPVLIAGEPGTGKGLLAEWIHRRSVAYMGAFVAVDCAAMGSERLLARLFGQASSSAPERGKKSLLEEAHEGTLFLDEVGALNIEAQSRLLSALDSKSLRRLGETRLRKSDFRLVCASSRNLDSQVDLGHFRTDLFHRLRPHALTLPPLRERLDDLSALCAHLLMELDAPETELQGGTLDFLAGQPWTGNIRELRTALVRALLMSEDGNLWPGDFVLEPAVPGVPPVTQDHLDVLTSPPPSRSGVRRSEAQELRALLQRFDGNKSKVARTLGISRSWLYRKLTRYGLHKGSHAEVLAEAQEATDLPESDHADVCGGGERASSPPDFAAGELEGQKIT